MSGSVRKSNLELWSGMDCDRGIGENGQQTDDGCIPKLILNGSANSSPQASPKLIHRSRGSKSSSPGATSITTTISEELFVEKSSLIEGTEGSLLIERDDIANRSTESVKSSDASCRTADSSNSCKDVSIRDKKSSDKKRKSSSWYNVLNPTYKSKTEDFKRLFRDLPDSERLIVDYSCAMQKDILVQGRLYISQNFICFYANIFRWETCLIIKCKDITSMTKEKTALVIPNAIQVCTTNEKHFFTSFGARDKTYLMMFRVWQNALLDQPMSPQELWQWIHYSYGDDLGLTSDDDDYVTQTFTEEDLKSVNGFGANILRQHSNPNDSFSGHLLGDVPDIFDPTFMPIQAESLTPFGIMTAIGADDNRAIDENDDRDEDAGSNSDDDNNQMPSKTLILNGGNNMIPNSSSSASVSRINADGRLDESLKNGAIMPSKFRTESPTAPPSDLSDSELDLDSAGEIQCQCETHQGRELLNRVLPYSVDTVIELLFSDSAFIREFQHSRKTTDWQPADWRSHKDGKVRSVSYTVYVNLVGVKTAQAVETHIMHPTSKRGKVYIIDVEAVTTGIPYSDHFYTAHRYCITKLTGEECRAKVTSQIKYKKNVWPFIKTFIEKNTWSALEEYFRDLDAFFMKEATKNARVSLPPKLDIKNNKYRPKDRTSKIKDHLQTRQDQTWATGATPDVKETIRSTSTSDVLVPFILLVLILLLILNALLYYKLWALEANTMSNARNVFPDFVIDPELLRRPKTNDEWAKLIHRQESLHQAEIMKWREVIDTVVSLLQQTEDSLISLKHKILPYGKSNHDEMLQDNR
ncbi:hypothetical protein CHUAL_001696 [Chamberlinius hualienensis]